MTRLKSIHSRDSQKLRKWLVQMREKSGLTQRAMAEELGVHHSIVGKIEIGERRLDVVEFIACCQVLGADPVVGIRVVQGSEYTIYVLCGFA